MRRRTASATLFSALVLLVLLSSAASAKVVYVKRDSPGTGTPVVYDGTSWDTAYHKVQDGINAAVSGDEVWVAKGAIYVENIVLKDGVALYGGFNGSETALAQRNWKANETILNGGMKDSVVIVPADAGSSTRIDGFTITNGRGTGVSPFFGGGICCNNSSATIANSLITGNSAGYGGGIYCASASTPVIKGNTITRNTTSYAISGTIHISNASPTVTENSVSLNTGAGVYCRLGSAKILTNQITDNAGRDAGGVYLDTTAAQAVVANNMIIGNRATGTGTSVAGGLRAIQSTGLVANNTFARNTAPIGAAGGMWTLNNTGTPTIANNIIALNSSGVYGAFGNVPTTYFRRNIVYGNGTKNYEKPIEEETRNYLNTVEDPAFVDPSAGDYHIQAHSPCVDQGDDTVLGTGWVDIDSELRVFGTHVDIGADESYATEWPEGAAIRVSSTGNDLYSGMSWARPKRTIQAAIDVAAPKGGEIWVKAGTYMQTMQPFWPYPITLRPNTRLYGGFSGTEIYRNQRDWVTNVTILDGNRQGAVIIAEDLGDQECIVDGFTIRNGITQSSVGGGVKCLRSTMQIRNNIITANDGQGIYCHTMSGTIAGNTIISNNSQSLGIRCINGTPMLTVTGNRIVGNPRGGIDCGPWAPRTAHIIVTDNVFAQNGDGVYVYGWGTTIQNNTFVDNVGQSGAIVCIRTYSDTVQTACNNIVAFNYAGITPSSAEGILRNNCVFGNTKYNTVGAEPQNGGVAADPLFVNRAGGDYHLLPGSPCIDGGSNEGAPSLDIDALPRPMDGDGNGVALADIGAYEVPSASYAKSSLPDGSSIGLTSVAVTATSLPGPAMYVENSSRSNGIRVCGEGIFCEGQLVNVLGAILTDTSTGERYVLPDPGWPKQAGGTAQVRPVTLAGRLLGGGSAGLQDGVWGKGWFKTPTGAIELRWAESGFLNNIGLLVTVFGNITHTDDGFSYLDDGSRLDDGSGHLGVKVLAAGLTFPSTGYCKVTGISSCEKNAEGKIVRVLKVRKQEDIQAL